MCAKAHGNNYNYNYCFFGYLFLSINIMNQANSSNGSGNPTQQEIKNKLQHLQELKKNNDHFGIELELIAIRKDWGISSEESRRLMEEYDHSQAGISPPKKLIKRISSGVFLFIQLIGQVSLVIGTATVVIGALAFITEADKRKKATRNEAWQIVNTIEGKKIKASAGRIEALMSLNQGCLEEKEPFLGIFPASVRKIPVIEGFFPDCVNLNNLKLEAVQLVSINLPWANLQDANFMNANLEEANLQNAKLQNANFTDSRLRNIELQNADLSNAKLNNALMIGANLRGANLKGADLRGADLKNADLRGANFLDANLEGIIMTGAIFDQQTKPFEGIKNFFKDNYAYFIDDKIETKMSLYKANLQNIDLSETNLANANLKGANLRNTKLRKSHLEGANLKGANLRGSDLTGAYINEKTIFTNVIYDEKTEKYWPIDSDSDHKNRNYKIKSTADLQNADLKGADLRDADLIDADLRNADLTDADLRGSILTKAELSGATLNKIIYDITTKFPTKFYEEKARDEGYKLDFYANLQKVNLEGRNLMDSMLKGANLTEAKLKNSEFSGSNLSNANLSGADFQNTNLKDVNLKDATVEKTNFRGAIFKNTDIDEIDFTKALGLSVKQIKQAKNVDKAIFNSEFKKLLIYFEELNKPKRDNNILKGINLSNDKFNLDPNNDKFNLTKSEFQNANLEGAKFENVDLSESNFFHANLKGVHFKKATLKEVNFKAADIEKADFKNALELSVEQIKQAKNWEKAIFSPEFKKKLDSKP